MRYCTHLIIVFFHTPDIFHSRRKCKTFQLSVKQINAKNIALDSVYLQHVLFFAECLTFCSEVVIYAVLSRGHFVMNSALLGVKYSGLTMRECKKNDKYQV